MELLNGHPPSPGATLWEHTAFCKQPISDWAAMDGNICGHRETVWLGTTTAEAHASIATKDAAAVSRVRSRCSPFLAPTTNHSIVKRENHHGTPKIMIVASPCVHVCTSCECF